MDRFPFRNREWMKLNRTKAQAPAVRPRRPAALHVENLEGRVVMASSASVMGQLAQIGHEISDAFGGGGGFGPRGFPGGGGPGGFGPGGASTGVGNASVLGQDAASVNKAYQTFSAAITADVAALRLTATTTGAPTADGLTAFDSAVATAVSTLNSSISSSLSGLTNTGAALTSTIEGYTSTLQTEIDSAATGLANSTNTSVLALNREIAGYVRTASSESTQAILTDAPTGTLTGSTVQTFNKSVQTALQTFSTAINTAKQAAITNGTTLDSTAVASAVSTLQSSLDSAVSSLGTAFTSSTYNPTTALDTLVSGLTSSLTSITAPTAGSTSSARTFSFAINSVLMKAQMSGTQLVATAISQYNQSLL